MSRIVAFAEQELGLTLRPGQIEMLNEFEAGGFSTAVWQCGRRGGKSLIADIVALFDATTRDLRQYLLPGEPRISGIIAQNLQKAQGHVARCTRLAKNSPRLRAMILRESADELVFSNGSVIQALPCSARSVRGDPWSLAILDEVGHFITSEEGNAAGDRVLEATTPSLAQFGDQGWLMAISTPLWRQGAFWKLVEQAKSGRFPRMHYAHKSTREMNPAISETWLEEQRRKDPESYAREYMAEFIDGASSYLTSADVVSCVKQGRGILPPPTTYSGQQYVAALDPAFSIDNFAMAIGHRDLESRAVIDGVWTWRRKGFEVTLDAVAGLARSYRITSLRTDQHAAEPIREGLARRGLHADYQPWTSESKADAFAALKIALNTRTIELPDDSELVEELCGLEARPTPGGFTRIAATGSGHDDRAIVVASVTQALVNGVPTDISAELDAASHGPGVIDVGGPGNPWRGMGDFRMTGPTSGIF